MVLQRLIVRSSLAYRCLLVFRKIRRRLFPIRDITAHLEAVLKTHSGVFFVQVGSNDGKHGDPLHPLITRQKGWRGIFIEPVPYAFEGLRNNYRNEARFIFENVAISSKREKRPFYYVSKEAINELGEELPLWYDQLGSFDKDHIGKHLEGRLEPYKKRVDIDCVPLRDLFDKHELQQVDLLHIDTEGFDYEVLKQFDFDQYRPLAILYENKHLSNADAASAEMMLLDAGYKIYTYPSDTLAVRL